MCAFCHQYEFSLTPRISGASFAGVRQHAIVRVHLIILLDELHISRPEAFSIAVMLLAPLTDFA